MDRLLEARQSELLGYSSNMLRNQADAENVLQATLLHTTKRMKWMHERSTCFAGVTLEQAAILQR